MTKAIRISLYWDKITKQKLLFLKNKYKLSISTILDILINTDIYKCDYLKNKNFYKYEKKERTTIKPKFQLELSVNEKTKITNNIAFLYCHGEFGKYADLIIEQLGIKEDKKNEIKNKIINDYLNHVQKELETRTDLYYLYNETTRNQIKFYKENKEYLKKISKE